MTVVEPALSEKCLKWQSRSKVPPNARCVPSYDFSTPKANVQRKFTNKLLLDLAHSDFHLFLHLKKHLARKKFDNDDEVQEEVMMWFKGLAADFCDSGIQKLVPRLNKCLNNVGDYVEIIKLCTGISFTVSRL